MITTGPSLTTPFPAAWGGVADVTGMSGRTEPVPATSRMSVGYANIALVPRLGSGVPFVARHAELAQLRAALQRASEGNAGAVLVSGDAGVGKSRVLTEFAELARAEGAEVFVGRCLGIGEAGLPFLPFMEIIEQLRAAHEDAVADRLPLTTLTGHGGVRAPAAAQQDLGQLQLFDAVLGALSDAAAEHPVVLEIEDLHWSDPSTRDLMSFLLSRLSTQRVLIVATYRSDDLHRQHPLRPFLAEIVRLPAVDRLDLKPFDAAESLEFVRALAEDVIDERLAVDVAERSEGNAFFAEELFAAQATDRGGIPTALADVLLARFEQLSPAAQRVVGAVSVTGRRRVRHATLRSVLGIDEDVLETALRESVQHHILVSDDSDSYAFRHALQREAIYADLLPGERVRLHAAYARLIVDNPEPGLSAALAHHSLRSNDLALALTASVQAADEAMRVGALGAELRHVEQALELWHAVDDPEGRAGIDELGLMRKATYVAGAAGHPERALAFAQASVPLADATDDPVLAADVRRVLTHVLLANGRWDDAATTIDDAWQLIRDSPPSHERAWVLATRARSWRPSDESRVHELAEAAVRDARESGSLEVEADALISLAFGRVRMGEVEEACELLDQARARAVEARAPNVELRALFNLVTTRYEQGLPDLAATIADDADRRAVELGLTWSTYGLEIRWMRAMVHYARGSWDEAAVASRPPGEHVSDTITALLAACSVMVSVGRGEFDTAERHLAALRPEWHRDSQIAMLAGIAGTELACWRERPEGATSVVDEALDSMRKSSTNEWPLGGIRLATLAVAAQADLARAARQRRDSAAEKRAVEAGEHYAAFARETAERGHPRGAEMGPEGRAWLARATAEEARLHGQDDPQVWHAVVDAFGYGEVYHVALARRRLAEALIAAGERDAAAAEISTALATAEQLGATPLADAVRQLARRARVGLAGGTAPVAELLTPREHAVLALVAQGHTNRQVGDELFISEKTVSVHVSRAMAKLGAASRTEAVALAYQRGLLEHP